MNCFIKIIINVSVFVLSTILISNKCFSVPHISPSFLAGSGVPNFCAVGMALRQLDYMPVGIRLDIGDFAYQSVVVI